MPEHTDIAIVGAGAAGLMAAIWAGRAQSGRRMVMLDGARKPGAKILVSGGGRCNVTHDVVDESAYAGSSRNAVKKVLRRFDAAATVAFFRDLGVDLKREDSGKLFPVSDSARTVLDALLFGAQSAGVMLRAGCRVEAITRINDHFLIGGAWGQMTAERVILATGGKSLPKSGSDGQGYALVQALGHSITRRVFPALVPLTLPRDHFICSLSGLTLPAALEVWSAAGKRLLGFTDSTLCTHFGLSGPSVLDISRYYLDAKFDDPDAQLVINWLPSSSSEQIESVLQSAGNASLLRVLGEGLPERLVRALCAYVGVEPALASSHLTRAQRKALTAAVTHLVVPVTGNRGFTYAEVTAGGVPLSELRLESMESRVCPALHLCGEICDVDGRIGGYNFQWAWASGYVAGLAAGAATAS